MTLDNLDQVIADELRSSKLPVPLSRLSLAFFSTFLGVEHVRELSPVACVERSVPGQVPSFFSKGKGASDLQHRIKLVDRLIRFTMR